MMSLWLKEYIHFWIFVFPEYLMMKYHLRNSDKYRKMYIKSLLDYVKVHCTYYKEKLDSLDINIDNIDNVLRTLPVVSKSMIRENYDCFLSDEIDSNHKKWANTGGSTGEPFKFPYNKKRSKPIESAHQYYMYRKMGWHLWDTIVAFDGSRIPEHDLEKRKFWREMPNFAYGHYRFSTLYLNDDTLCYYVKQLNKIKPKIIRGYPSAIIELSKYLYKNGNLEFIPIGVYLTSESVTSEQRQYISNIMKCPVWGQYGHTEMSVFGISYPNNEEYICSPLYGETEVLNPDGFHVKVGEVGEIVVTGFSLRALPFIRYKTGDLAKYGGKKDGWAILSSLQGRSVDYIINSKNEKVYLIGFIFGGHLKCFNVITNWQIQQNEIGVVDLLIVKSTEWCQDYERDLYDLFKSKDIILKIKYVNDIPKTNRGKKKFLVQNLE